MTFTLKSSDGQKKSLLVVRRFGAYINTIHDSAEIAVKFVKDNVPNLGSSLADISPEWLEDINTAIRKAGYTVTRMETGQEVKLIES